MAKHRRFLISTSWDLEDIISYVPINQLPCYPNFKEAYKLLDSLEIQPKWFEHTDNTVTIIYKDWTKNGVTKHRGISKNWVKKYYLIEIK